MIHYKNDDEIELIRESAQLVSKTLGMIAEEIRPGISTRQLDSKAEIFILDHKAKPGFKGLYGCPSTLLTSVNEQVVHGLPSDKPLKDGDIVSVDCGVKMNGFYGDQAYTFAVGEINPDVKQLLKVTKESLYLGIEKARVGNRIGDISNAIQQHAENYGYGVVESLVGHGLGRKLHEEPNVPNFGKPGRGKIIKNGLVIAIEPMINMGGKKVKTLSDKWTVVSADGKPSCHYEHDVAIVNGMPVILSTFEFVEKVLEKRGIFYVKNV